MAFFFFLDSPFSCSLLVHVVHVDSLLTIVVCCRPSAVGRSSLSVFPLSFLICGEREEEEENDDDDQRVERGGGGRRKKWMFGGFFRFVCRFDCSSASLPSASMRKMMDVNRGPRTQEERRGGSGEENVLSLSLSLIHSRTAGMWMWMG